MTACAKPSLQRPISQACTQEQADSPVFDFWCRRLKESPIHHRKQWEWCYIMQALAMHGMLAPGRMGLGFGVGAEPITDLMASYGCQIVATDLDRDRAMDAGWVDTNQHADSLRALRSRGIAPAELFERNVNFLVVDMNDIPVALRDFDFTWSACALEHLGSIEKGFRFIENSLQTLRPGGIAVHTTELNCSSDTETVDNDWCVLYRKRDIKEFGNRLKALGYKLDLNFHLGDLPHDKIVDVPPYSHNPHLKLKLGEYTTTSYGLIIQRPL